LARESLIAVIGIAGVAFPQLGWGKRDFLRPAGIRDTQDMATFDIYLDATQHGHVYSVWNLHALSKVKEIVVGNWNALSDACAT